jgi:cyclomaltodextrinase / maltogenic alpha-amylase / neopullulanase
MPGIPSIYYGSEWGMTGKRTPTSDAVLRPATSPARMRELTLHPDLYHVIQNLIALRHQHEALRSGMYEQIHVGHEQFSFVRGRGLGAIAVVVNAAETSAQVTLKLAGAINAKQLTDVLNPGSSFPLVDGRCMLGVPPRWGRILVLT